MSFLTERTMPVLMNNTVAGASFIQTSVSSVDLQAYQADSLLIVAVVNATSLTGYTITAQGGATTSALGGYCAVPGSTSTLVTWATTNPGTIGFLDLKNCPHRYVGAKHTGLGDHTNVTVIGFPYDSKKQAVPITVSSTVSGTGYYQVVNPTTA